MSSAVRPIWRARTALGQLPDQRGSRPSHRGRHHHGAERAQLRLVERARRVNARLETSSETVKPIPAHAPAASSTGPLIGDRGPCSAGRDAIQEPANTPIGLPTTYAEQDPQRDRRGDRVAQQLAGHVDARRWPARTAARSRSSSMGAARTEAARWARSPTAGSAAPSARAPASAARGTIARQRRRPLEVLARGRVRARREPDRQAGDHRVDPGLEHRDPDRDREPDRDRGAARTARSAAPPAPRTTRPRSPSATNETCSVYTVAITTSAARSSTTASVSRNTRIRVAVRGVTSATAAERERRIGRHRRRPSRARPRRRR